MALQLLLQTYTVAVKFTGLAGELRVDSSNWDLLLDDGVTPGGHRFLNITNADERYQARSSELDGLLEFEPQNRGFLVRRGPADYRVREIKVNPDNMTISESKGYGGNPTFSLAGTIESDHTFAGKQTFEQEIAGDGGFKGDLTGNVTGDVVGDLTGDSRGKHTGSLDTTGGTVAMAAGQIELEWLEDVILQRLCPVGSILIWSGAVNAIPTGWKLCNGANNTPDLRDRFIMGAGGDQLPNDTGGNELLESPITINEAGAHKHTIADGVTSEATTGVTVSPAQNSKVDAGGSAKNVPRLPFTTNDPGHHHTFEGTETSESLDHTHGVTVDQEKLLPPFYALCYIMKVG